jgi:hypothetical protein
MHDELPFAFNWSVCYPRLTEMFAIRFLFSCGKYENISIVD